MAIKDRITGLFKRGNRGERGKESSDPGRSTTGTLTPSEASDEERQEVLRKLGDGFTNVGKVIDSLDRHLEAGTRSLEGMTQTQNRLPGMLEQQRELIERTNSVAQSQQEALELFKRQLLERDEVNKAMVDRLEEIGKGLQDLREQDRSRMDMLMHFQRAGRRSVLLLGLLGVFVILLLMALLIILSMRPDLLGLDRVDAGDQQSAAPPPAASDLDQARRSPDPQIRAFADAVADARSSD